MIFIAFVLGIREGANVWSGTPVRAQTITSYRNKFQKNKCYKGRPYIRLT